MIMIITTLLYRIGCLYFYRCGNAQSSETLLIGHDDRVVMDKALKENEVFVFLVLQGICQLQVNFLFVIVAF